MEREKTEAVSPSLKWVRCAGLRLQSFTLTPEPISQPAPSTSYPSLHAVPQAICRWQQGTYAAVARGHTLMLTCTASHQVSPIPESHVVAL